jgi:hypothetical protein
MGVGVARLGRYSVLLSDVDVVWLRDPSQFLAAPGLRAADVAVTSDCIFDFMRPDQQVDDPYGQRRSVLNAEFNTGEGRRPADGWADCGGREAHGGQTR